MGGNFQILITEGNADLNEYEWKADGELATVAAHTVRYR